MAPVIGMADQGGQIIGSPTLMKHSRGPTFLGVLFPNRLPRATAADRRAASNRRHKERQEKRTRKAQKRLEKTTLTHGNGHPSQRSLNIRRAMLDGLRQHREAARRTAREQKRSSKQKRRQMRADVQQNLDRYLAAQDARRKYDQERRKRTTGLWGFDLAAGLKLSPAEGWDPKSGCYVRHGRIRDKVPKGQYEVDYTGRITGKQFVRGWKWGVEVGGPGKEGFFGHGILKKRQQVAVPADPRGEVPISPKFKRAKTAKSEKLKWPNVDPNSEKWWLRRES